MKPTASIIIPCYNQALRLEITLQSLCNQCSIERDTIEIIVVNDGSTDETEAIIERFAAVLPLKSIFQGNSGRAAARNAGIHASMGSILLFTDADRPVSNYWVRNHTALHCRQVRSVGVGDIREFYFSNLVARMSSLIQAIDINFASLHRYSRSYSYWEFVKKTLDSQGLCLVDAPWIMTLVGNLSVNRSLLEEVGPFDASFSGWGFEHFELGYRLNKAGASFYYVTDATNYHLAHTRPANFYQEQMRDSFNQFLSKFPEPTVGGFWHLLHGQLSLGEFDQIATGGKSCLPVAVRDVRYKAPLNTMMIEAHPHIGIPLKKGNPESGGVEHKES